MFQNLISWPIGSWENCSYNSKLYWINSIKTNWHINYLKNLYICIYCDICKRVAYDNYTYVWNKELVNVLLYIPTENRIIGEGYRSTQTFHSLLIWTGRRQDDTGFGLKTLENTTWQSIDQMELCLIYSAWE